MYSIPLGFVLILSVSGGTARAQGGAGVAGVAGERPLRVRSPEGWGPLRGRWNVQPENGHARSINEDTWQRWNQYLYLSNEEATRKYLAKKNDDIQKNKDSYNGSSRTFRTIPRAKDVENGDALERRARPAQRSADPELFAEESPRAHYPPRSSPIFRFVMHPKRSPSS